MIGRLTPIEKAAGSRWALFQRYVIPCWSGRTYLERLRIVQTPWGGLYLHRIAAKDSDVPHDHPWDFRSFILWGGYTEVLCNDHKPVGTVDRKRWRRWQLRRAEVSHYIATVQPHTYTLLLVGPRKRNWGFWTDHGWVPWREHERP